MAVAPVSVVVCDAAVTCSDVTLDPTPASVLVSTADVDCSAVTLVVVVDENELSVVCVDVKLDLVVDRSLWVADSDDCVAVMLDCATIRVD